MAKTARRILAVDEGARADHALVPAAPSMALLAGLQKKGFSQRWIAKALGYKHFATQFVHESEQITAAKRLTRRSAFRAIWPRQVNGASGIMG
jgi:hypothetical protein